MKRGAGMNAEDDGRVAKWMLNNPGKLLSAILVVGAVGASWSVAQYQIFDLRQTQVEMLSTQSTLSKQIDLATPKDHDRRINKLENGYERIVETQAELKSELGVVRTIVERIEKRM